MIELIYKKVEGSVKPIEFDTESSSSTVYIRRNIHEVVKEDENNETETIQWEYEECALPVETYKEYQSYFHTQQIMKEMSEQELALAESLAEKDEQIQSLAQTFSELELKFYELQEG